MNKWNSHRNTELKNNQGNNTYHQKKKKKFYKEVTSKL